jgi:hypothetical protein
MTAHPLVQEFAKMLLNYFPGMGVLLHYGAMQQL